MDTIRFFQVYIVQGVLCVFFLFLAYRILTRKKNRLNVVFSAFYFSEAIGLIINFIYAPLEIWLVVKILNALTNFFSFYSVMFLLVFVLIVSKSEAVFNRLKQRILMLISGAVYFCSIFIAFIPELGVNITAPDFTPNWGLLFFFYLMTITTVFSTIPTLYYIVKIYNDFEAEGLRDRWRFFLWGIILLYLFMYSIYFRNTFFPGTIFSTILAIIGFFLVILASISIYYGVGRQLA